MSLALSTCIFRLYYMYISLMQSVNGVQFLNITFLLALFAAATAAEMSSTDIVPLTSTYVSF